MVRNILIAILAIVTVILYYQNSELSSYLKNVEKENQQLRVQLRHLTLESKEQAELKYFSPLYMQTQFYSALPYKYQWYLQNEYQHIENYKEPDMNSWIDFYNELNILPEVNYDKENDDLSIKLQMKTVF